MSLLTVIERASNNSFRLPLPAPEKFTPLLKYRTLKLRSIVCIKHILIKWLVNEFADLRFVHMCIDD